MLLFWPMCFTKLPGMKMKKIAAAYGKCFMAQHLELIFEINGNRRRMNESGVLFFYKLTNNRYVLFGLVFEMSKT